MSDLKYCDKENGCPYYLPIKCSDGSCAESESKCPEKPICSEGKKLCPDGSCLSQSVVCPSLMGCPTDTPFKCANGECINPKKQHAQYLPVIQVYLINASMELVF